MKVLFMLFIAIAAVSALPEANPQFPKGKGSKGKGK